MPSLWFDGEGCYFPGQLNEQTGKLDLKLNEEKTQVKDSRKESFEFLGFSVGIATGKPFKNPCDSENATENMILLDEINVQA